MRTKLLLFSGLLALGCLLGACPGPQSPGGSGSDAGTDSDAGMGRDGGTDGGVPLDAGSGTVHTPSGCDVAMQRGCDAGASCLRGQLDDGGQGSVCFPGECDVVAQNCAAGSRCTYVRSGSETHRRCVPDGTSGEGAGCQTNDPGPDGLFYDTCKAGLFCNPEGDADGGGSFACRKFCYGGDTCAAPRDCVRVLHFTGSSELPRVCAIPGPSCDPLASTCASPLGCYPSTKSVSVCVEAGGMANGADCSYSNDCRPGSACVKSGTTQACRPLCRSPSGSPTCSSGRCEPLQDFTGVGACLP